MTRPADSAAWWLRTAVGDLAAARSLLGTASAPARGAAQFAHQAAEKALKAAIASTGEEPTRTHDLVYLTLRCDSDLQRTLACLDIAVLSAVLSWSRHPEVDDPPISRDQAQHWLADAREIVALAAAHLGVEVESVQAA
ncbi:MAG: HEPN domain-containing protein [Candidatus Limnocylindrales bacterium]|nr:HEPN domain-containing protein [Candidatus Limnocylindrales bacterium]